MSHIRPGLSIGGVVIQNIPLTLTIIKSPGLFTNL